MRQSLSLLVFALCCSAWGQNFCPTGQTSSTCLASTIASLTLNNSGSGASSGTTFNGSTAVTLSYNTFGAANSGANTNITSLNPSSTGATTPGTGAFTNLSNTLIQQSTAAVVASATTIAPTTPLVEISGTTAIATITLPTGFTSGCFDILPTGTWTTTTAGNIFNAVTAVADVSYRACYWPVISKWVLK